MANDAEVGRLHGALELDNDGFLRPLEAGREALARFAQDVAARFAEIQAALSRVAQEVQARFAAIEDVARKVGIGLTATFTASFAAMTVVAGRGAEAFQSAMGEVEAALLGVDSSTLEKLSQAAQELGPKVGRSAVEAAAGIETLGAAGMSTADILAGGLASSLKLAGANAADLGASAALLSDVMGQFRLSAGQLPSAVDKITGGLGQSKFAFDDFRLAMSQSASDAVGAGVTLDEFSATLAAISRGFASGSDAGTSLASAFRAMANPTKDAQYAMKQLGVEFYNADGSAKTMQERIANLSKAFANLDAETREKGFAKIAGDGSRALRQLANVGPAAFKSLSDAIGEFDAGDKLAVQLTGAKAASNNLRNAIERLNIALGDAGILATLSAVRNAAAGVVNYFGTMSPVLLKIGVGFWAVSAAIGPLILALLTVAKVVLPLLILRLTATSLAMRALQLGIAGLLNPVGLLVTGLGTLILRFTAVGTGLALLGANLVRFAGVIGIVVTGIGLLIYALSSASAETKKHGEVTAATADAVGKLNKIMEQDVSKEVAAGAKSVAEARLAMARATFQAAAGEIALRKAAGQGKLADLADGTETTYEYRGRAGSAVRVDRKLDTYSTRAGSELSRAKALAQQTVDQASKDQAALIGAYQGAIAQVKAAGEGDGTIRKVNLEDPGAGKKAKKGSTSGPSAADRAANFQQELARADDALLQAKKQLAADVQVQASYEHQLVDSAARQRDLDLANAVRDKQLTQTDAAIVAKKNDQLTELEHALVNRRLDEQLSRQELAATEAGLNNEADLLRAKQGLAKTSADRRAIELRLLEIQYEIERAQLESLLASKDISDADKAIARKRLEKLGELQATDRRTVEENTAGPLQSYFNSIPKTLAGINEQLETIAVKQLKRVEDGFANIATKVLHLHGALGEVIADLLRIVAQQAILAAEKGGGGFSGFLSGVGQAFAGFTGGGSGGVTGAQASAWSTSSGLPGWASGGSGTIVGRRGVDANMLQINGVNAARVSHGEKIRVEPAGGGGGRGGMTVHMPITLNAPGADAAALGRLQTEVRTLKAELPGRAIAAVLEAQARRIT